MQQLKKTIETLILGILQAKNKTQDLTGTKQVC
jgi:hypothetical protein